MHTLFSKLVGPLFFGALFAPAAFAGDWAEWRGPARAGVSTEKNLPARWSPAGENLAWKAPYGGRSAPIVLGDRLYLQNSVGKGEQLQERVLCLDANTGKLMWEHRFNVYLSDVPPHRVGWASPAADPQTGNIFVFGSGGTLLSLTRDGKVLWERSLGEDFGLLTTHGGRTVSPLIDGDLVIISGVTFMWGQHGRGAHRFMAFDKKSGETMWISAPGGRPYDTTYAPPIITNVSGARLLIQGASDGVIHAIKAQTGEPVWKYEISKRGINTGVVVKGATAILTHSEENLDSNEMGMIAAVDAGAKGEIKKEGAKWATYGWQGGFSSPVIDGERLYQLDNGANLAAFDVTTGKQLWLQNLGTIQKASPVFADGKLYVGTENGKFFILKPTATGAEILDQDQLGTERQPEAIIASVAISNGCVYLISDSNLYCIGKKSNIHADPELKIASAETAGPAAHVQIVPTELIIKPGDTVRFRVRLYDDKGNFIREETSATWSLDQLKGNLTNGQFVATADGGTQAGLVKATVNGITGAARVRVVSPLPWSENFDAMAANSIPAHWVNTTMKFAVRELEGGNKVLVKTTEGSSLLSRARAYMGPSNLSDYTVEADILATQKRRQQGDAGVIAQRYVLTLYGNSQMLHIEPWQPETARTVAVPFAWKPDVWYRMKLMVENLPDGKVHARGKVWPVGESEPTAWLIERVDPLPNRQGAPGIFGNALAEIYFDNLKVTPNK
ncbi:MAG: PQQ-binding-like beta-propeller repeat protein [Pyrinomonadaceae bacterium]|nr:PQQ-binding-like beta-propeller repeat protein [Pyrinomonadaceae bacterium]MDQ3586531.1 PQQ-binding-like beta-propeller repeat protein [Acidobacteriota bacterium]